MQNAMRIIPALAVAVTLAACADSGAPKQAASPVVAAHDPSMLGRGSSIVAAALPDYTTVESAGAGASNFCIVSIGTSQAGKDTPVPLPQRRLDLDIGAQDAHFVGHNTSGSSISCSGNGFQTAPRI